MNYAGFWLRLGAGIIDFLIFIPILFLYLYLRLFSWEIAIMIVIPYFFLWSIYNIYFHGRWGQTIGKMVTKIKVVRLDGSTIDYTHAFLRHAVDFLFSILSSIAQVVAILSVSKTTFESLGWMETNKIIYNNTPAWGQWGGHLSTIWIYSELAVLLFNKKKRAIHDFIAGTVVINLRRTEVRLTATVSINEKLDNVLLKLENQ